MFKSFKEIFDVTGELCVASEITETKAVAQTLVASNVRFHLFIPLCVYGIMSFQKSTTFKSIHSLKVFFKDKRNYRVEEALQFAKYNVNYSIVYIRSVCGLRFLKATKVPKKDSLGWTSLRFLEFVVEYELFD